MPVIMSSTVADILTGFAATASQPGNEALMLPMMLLSVALIAIKRLLDHVTERQMVLHHLEDDIPIRKASEIGIVDEHVRLELARAFVVPAAIRSVAVDGIEYHPPPGAEFDGLCQLLALSYGPEDELVPGRKFLQCINSPWTFRSDLWIAMLDYRPIKVYGDYHILLCFAFLCCTIAIAVTITIAITIAITVIVTSPLAED